VRASFGWLSMEPVRRTFGCLLRMFMLPLRPIEILKRLIPKRPPFSFFPYGDRLGHRERERERTGAFYCSLFFFVFFLFSDFRWLVKNRSEPAVVFFWM
jgi:hypothetical protein